MAVSTLRQNGSADYDLSQRIATESQGSFITDIDKLLTDPGAIGVPIPLVTIKASPGKMGYIRNITVGCRNKGFDVSVLVSTALYGGNAVVVKGSVRAGGGTITLPVDYWLHEGQTLNVNAIGTLPEGATSADPYVIRGCVNNVMFTQDTKFDARETLLALGDSVTAGNQTTLDNSHSSKDIYIFGVRDYLRSKGRDIRLVNWGLPGYSSVYYRTPMESGRFNVSNPTIITYCHGINDISATWNSTIQQNFQDAVNYMIAWKQALYPRAKLIIYGPTPQGDAKEGRIQNLRIWLEARVAALRAAGETLIFYCNLGDIFNPTDMSKYSDGGTHLNVLGNKAALDRSISFIDANNI